MSCDAVRSRGDFDRHAAPLLAFSRTIASRVRAGYLVIIDWWRHQLEYQPRAADLRAALLRRENEPAFDGGLLDLDDVNSSPSSLTEIST